MKPVDENRPRLSPASQKRWEMIRNLGRSGESPNVVNNEEDVVRVIHEFRRGIWRFAEVSTAVPSEPGIYQIYTINGIALKVGIAANIRRRLSIHYASRDSGLKLRPGGDRDNPKDVKSKASILAKHLYYDSEISPRYDLRTEAGRRSFLEHECYFKFQTTRSKNEARDLERAIEGEKTFRYVGPVRKR